ncbi:MAG: FtsL-like putative cell division protein [Bacteroidota bacterium]
MENTYKLPRREKRPGIFQAISHFLKIDGSLGEVIHVRFLAQILFVSFLCLLYIGNRHFAEKKIKSINLLERQVEDLRADYTTLKANYMFESKQSEIAKRAQELGLEESSEAPILITQD